MTRVRRIAIDVPHIAGTIEITSTEDYKGRGWGEPVARVTGPHDGWRVDRNDVMPLAEALEEAFALFEKEFGPDAVSQVRGDKTHGVSVAEVDQTTSLVVSHKFPWCRARLLHALAGAEEQGVLAEVLSELLDGMRVARDKDDEEGEAIDGLAVELHVRQALYKLGWTKKGEPPR